PDDFVDFFDGQLAEGGLGAVGAEDRGFEADEPLLGGAVDDRLVAAPAVRVRVLKIGTGQQRAGLFEHGDDDGIGVPDLLALEGGRSGMVPGARVDVDVARGVHAAGGVEAVALAGVEVVRAVGGGRVHGSGALVGGDVGGQHAEDAAI